MHVKRVIDLALSDEQVAEMIKAFKWPRAITCPRCGSANVKRNGKSDKRPGVQRYLCKDCGKSFSDVTGTIFERTRLRLRDAMLVLYLHFKLGLSALAVSRETGVGYKAVSNLLSNARETAGELLRFFQAWEPG